MGDRYLSETQPLCSHYAEAMPVPCRQTRQKRMLTEAVRLFSVYSAVGRWKSRRSAGRSRTGQVMTKLMADPRVKGIQVIFAVDAIPRGWQGLRSGSNHAAVEVGERSCIVLTDALTPWL